MKYAGSWRPREGRRQVLLLETGGGSGCPGEPPLGVSTNHSPGFPDGWAEAPPVLAGVR